MSEVEVIYWPEEGVPNFASGDGGETWIPLCVECGEALEPTPLQGMRCTVAPISHGHVFLWAEDWPDYEGD